ncbi:outer membrane beta-barrel protein [Mesonia aestuariivivens]|uniref:PorT family protein n=1 Tax=Mesonia aestuariivivens TaxID=2796128 RepID=A0ABS6W528_9FLAO|nr:PorT family protein [Mesonia aestuariivivens]
MYAAHFNVPVNLKYGNKLYLTVGPQIGFLLDTKKESADDGNLKSDIDFGLNIGGGYQFNQIFIELRIYQGLTTIYDFKTRNGAIQELKNCLLRLSLGYKL